MQRQRPLPIPSRPIRSLTRRSASPTFGVTMTEKRAEKGTSGLKDAIVAALRSAATSIPKKVEEALRQARDREEGMAHEELSAIVENLEVARWQGVPLCQDTGIPAFHVRAGARSPLPARRSCRRGSRD